MIESSTGYANFWGLKFLLILWLWASYSISVTLFPHLQNGNGDSIYLEDVLRIIELTHTHGDIKGKQIHCLPFFCTSDITSVWLDLLILRLNVRILIA